MGLLTIYNCLVIHVLAFLHFFFTDLAINNFLNIYFHLFIIKIIHDCSPNIMYYIYIYIYIYKKHIVFRKTINYFVDRLKMRPYLSFKKNRELYIYMRERIILISSPYSLLLF